MIGNKSIDKRLTLAPMTYLGHIAFRQVVESHGGYGLLFTEMCDSRKIPYENRYLSPFFRWRNEERALLVCQIYGDDPDIMARAAQRIQDEGFFGVDINFGCSSVAICRQKCGAALLQNPSLAIKIVDRIRRTISIPLFVKFRTGWQDDPTAAVSMARHFEEAGADAVTFHPRVAPDRRTRPPKWAYIGLVKQALSIPVFGNGNVFSASDCLQMLQQTDCDGVAIGRMAVAKPWIFAKWAGGINAGNDPFLSTVMQLAELLQVYYDPVMALQRFKRFAHYYAANFKFGHAFHRQVANAKTMRAAQRCAFEFLHACPEINSRPNLNFFI